MVGTASVLKVQELGNILHTHSSRYHLGMYGPIVVCCGRGAGVPGYGRTRQVLPFGAYCVGTAKVPRQTPHVSDEPMEPDQHPCSHECTMWVQICRSSGISIAAQVPVYVHQHST